MAFACAAMSVLVWCASAIAADSLDTQPHPKLSGDAAWAGALLIVILLGLFLPAAVIGPIVRALMPPEAPATHGADEHRHDEHGH